MKTNKSIASWKILIGVAVIAGVIVAVAAAAWIL